MKLFLATSGLVKFESAMLLVVTAGLVVLAKIVSDLRAEVRSLRESSGKVSPPPLPHGPVPPALPAKSAQAPEEEIPAGVMAAIVSAVHYTLGETHRVISVAPTESLVWSQEGRRSIFRSHTFR